MRKEIESATESPTRAIEPRRKRRQPALQIVASPAYDLLLSIHVTFCPPRIYDYELDTAWTERARATCPPDLAETLTFFFGNDEESQWCAVRLCALLGNSPAPADITATLDWLEHDVPVEDVMILLMEHDGLGEDWREVAASLLLAHTTKGNKKSDLSTRTAAFVKRFPAGEREAVQRFVTAPDEERKRLIDSIRAWYALVFAAEVPRIEAILAREVARIDRRRADTPVEDIFTSVIRGIEYDPPAAVDRLVLAPSTMIMPTVFHFRTGDTLTYCFPVLDAGRSAADSETAQRQEMVRLFEALADDTRLRILRHLVDRQMYLTELSEHLRLTKATTRHHMIRLRAAGLVTLHMRDHLSYYSLNRETLDEPTRVLLRYLGPA